MRSHFRAEFCALCHLILWRTERRVVSTQVTTSARKNITNLIEILNQIRDTDKRKAAIAGFLEERLESEKKLAEERLESEKKLAEERLESEKKLALAEERLESEKKLAEERLESEKKLALAEERLESEKKLAEERLKLKLAESEKKLALAEERLKSQKEIHELHAQIANVEILHAKGLLTARGVFERAAHLAFFEMNLKGAVNTTQALREVGNASKLGVWTQHLRDAAAYCAPKEQTSDLLISVWQELSLDVHGFSWKGPDVQFSASLSEQAKCVVEELCKKNGLENKESVINTFSPLMCAKEKKSPPA